MLSRRVVVCLLCCTFWLIPGLCPAATWQGLEPGMTLDQARQRLRAITGDPQADFMESICEIPLGLDVLDGVPVATRDTGIVMQKALDMPPLYFYQGRLFGIKENLSLIEEFLALKNRFPAGRFQQHTIPGLRAPVTVFTADEGRIYAFSNRYNDLYILDNAARKSVAASLRGSVCWHGMRSGPNQNSFAADYARCVARYNVNAALRRHDAALCKQFCSQTHPALANTACAARCDQALSRAGAGE